MHRIVAFLRSDGPQVVYAPSVEVESDPEQLALRLYTETARNLLDVQISTSDVLDSRVATSLGVGTTILPIVFGLLSLGPTAPSRWVIGFMSAAMATYGLLLFYSLKASIGKKIDNRPNVEELYLTYIQASDPASFERWIADEYADAVATNEEELFHKARRAGIVTWALHVEGFTLAIAGILSFPDL